MNKIIEAIQFAAERHGTQQRKGTGRPYTDHLYRVMGAVAERTDVSEELVIAAVLHDTLEDTNTLKQEIADKFGITVMAYVCVMTKSKDDRPRKVRNAEYFYRLSMATREVKILKMIDRLDNLGEVTGMGQDFVNKYCMETSDLLRAVGDADPVLREQITKQVNELYTFPKNEAQV